MYAKKYNKKPISSQVVAKQVVGLAGLYINTVRMIEEFTWAAYSSTERPFGEVPPTEYFNKTRIDVLIDSGGG